MTSGGREDRIRLEREGGGREEGREGGREDRIRLERGEGERKRGREGRKGRERGVRKAHRRGMMLPAYCTSSYRSDSFFPFSNSSSRCCSKCWSWSLMFMSGDMHVKESM